MHKILLVFVFGFCSMVSFGQLSVGVNTKGTKFKDMVENHEKSLHLTKERNENKVARVSGHSMESEEKAYLFDRWKWYWAQHLDQNGYVVSPSRTWDEWKKMQMVHSRHDAAKTTSSAAAWTFVGPDSSDANGDGVGRINYVEFHPTLPNTYLIGSPGGGVWRTTDNGYSWTCLTDQMPLLSVSVVKYNPQNPNVIYVCTGDRDGDDYWSIGLFRSTDGGSTWHPTSLVFADSDQNLCNSMLINPSDTNTLIVGTVHGIYISHDAGNTWAASDTAYNFKQLLYNPIDTNVVYATSHFNSTLSEQAHIFRSSNGGNSWTPVTSMTDGDAYRITLAVTPADPSIVMALVAASDASNMFGLYDIQKSTDTGHTFSEIYSGGCSGGANLLSFNADGTGCSGQGFYDLTLAIDPSNSSNCFLGGVNAWQSYDGGGSWSIMTQWSNTVPGVPTIHADKHFMGFHPLVAGRFFECNDGGIYWADNPSTTSTWNNATNHLGIEEIYRVAVSGAATYELTGAQDDGTKEEQFGTFSQIFGGDGMECAIDPQDSNTAYVSSEYGNIVGSISGSVSYVSQNIPGTPAGGWVTPFIILPYNHKALLAGYQDVWKSDDFGNTWVSVNGSTGLVTTDILRVVTSISDTNTIYAAEDFSNNIHFTTGTPGSWNTISPTAYPGAMTSDIKVDLYNAAKIWVTYSGYGTPHVLSCDVPSSTWTEVNAGLPDVPVNCIIIDTATAVKYIGTDIGVYYMDTFMTSWAPFTTGMPVVRVNDLEIDYHTGTIWAATYGRSLWSSPKIPAHTAGVSAIPFSDDYLTVSPNPSSGSFKVAFGSEVSEKSVKATLINADGKIVWKSELQVAQKSVSFQNLSLAKGVYTLCIDGADSRIGVTKVIIR